MQKIRLAIAGVGNCASSLVQGLEYYRDKAIKLDERVFQMRTLLQSGKGFSEILNLDALLHAFMAVCRERYGVTSSAVLLAPSAITDLAVRPIRRRGSTVFAVVATY